MLMVAVLLIIHLFVTLALIGVVLIQRSEGGGLGVGSSQGMGAFMSGRGTANLLTRTTAVLAALFFGLSLTLALLNKGTAVQRSVLDLNPPAGSTAPVVPAAPGGIIPGSSGPGPGAPLPAGPAAPAPTAPAPGGPSVPTH
jgi:preprotein translocase subunit SecG